MTEDRFTHTEADAGAYARAYAEPDDDRPSASDLAADDMPVRRPPTLSKTGVKALTATARRNTAKVANLTDTYGTKAIRANPVLRDTVADAINTAQAALNELRQDLTYP